MGEHFASLEADFQAHYGLDLREMLWGPAPVGARRVYGLIAGLPKGSTFHREMGWDWSNTDEFLATLLESYVRVHSDRKTKPFKVPRPWEKEPKPQPKQEVKPEQRTVATVDEMKGFFRGAIRHDKKVNHGS